MTEPAQHLLDRLKIRQIPTPNPFSDVETNCYFIDGPVPVLIDSGLATREAYQRLSDELLRMGRRIRDIRKIFLTHGHADHRALAPRLQDETGAEVFYHEAEHDKVVLTAKEEEARQTAFGFFRSLGVPEENIPQLVDGPPDPPIKPKLPEATPLVGGEEVSLGAVKLRTVHTPGHSCGSLCFVDEESGLLFSGDTLLPSTRITALIELDPQPNIFEYNPLELHLRSLARIEELNPQLVLPGHGDVFQDYSSITNQVRQRHEKRQKHILRALRHEPKTLYQICRSVFLSHSHDDLYLALSDTLGNVKILLDKQMIKNCIEEDVFFYEKL